MANIANPRKQFQFSISAPGLNPFLAQKVTIPEESFDVTEHADTNFDVKTAGRRKVGKLMIDKISTALGPDNWIDDWINEVGNTFLGGGLIPAVYKRTVTIDEYSNDGVTIINSYICYGCFPSKRNGIELDRKGSDNTLQSIELEVDQVKKV